MKKSSSFLLYKFTTHYLTTLTKVQNHQKSVFRKSIFGTQHARYVFYQKCSIKCSKFYVFSSFGLKIQTMWHLLSYQLGQLHDSFRFKTVAGSLYLLNTFLVDTIFRSNDDDVFLHHTHNSFYWPLRKLFNNGVASRA